jgi:hypothetical protein
MYWLVYSRGIHDFMCPHKYTFSTNHENWYAMNLNEWLVICFVLQMRPLQVKTTKDFPEVVVPKDFLYYKSYSVIYVLDKK